VSIPATAIQRYSAAALPDELGSRNRWKGVQMTNVGCRTGLKFRIYGENLFQQGLLLHASTGGSLGSYNLAACFAHCKFLLVGPKVLDDPYTASS